jgi:hypothetical protein
MHAAFLVLPFRYAKQRLWYSAIEETVAFCIGQDKFFSTLIHGGFNKILWETRDKRMGIVGVIEFARGEEQHLWLNKG